MKYIVLVIKNIGKYTFGWIGSRYIYKEILFPFFYSILVVTFVLLVNFLVRTVDKLLGKGLPISIIFEFFYLNLAWIIALSVPMAVLVATLTTYGRLAEDNEMTAMRASGISFWSILTPGIIFGSVMCLFMIYFNDNILPDFNHRARILGRDIYKKRPDLDIEPGYFIENISGYSIYVKSKEGDKLNQVVIYSSSEGEYQVNIYAKYGFIKVVGNSVIFDLHDGEIHELNRNNLEDYRILKFDKHRMVLSIDNLVLERSDVERRGDREMTIKMMIEKIEKYNNEKERVKNKIISMVSEYLPEVKHKSMKDLIKLIKERKAEINKGNLDVQTSRFLSVAGRVIGEFQLYMVYQRQVNKYLVEIHKKFSIPFACIVFVLIGAPLGVMVKKGGIFMGGTLSIIFFIIYYVFLIGGEELADMAYISPFWAMWTPNILLFIIGLYLIHYIRWEQRTIEFKFITNLLAKLKIVVKEQE
ncbi:MAG: LptF/LptG family permease [Candidatus Marinimicrobia bacterium]|nr:LptF/LptG family permease [Candidatus Neomarinimicrobiota bacterium]